MSGIVVEHNETGVRYAVSEHNYNPDVHKRIRALKPGETTLGFQPKPKTTRNTYTDPVANRADGN